MHKIALDTYATIFSTVVNVLFGSVIYLRNTKSRVNILYSIMVLVVSLWGVVNYASNGNYSHLDQLILNKLAFGFGFFVVLSVWILSAYFPSKSPYLSWQIKIAYIVAPITVLISSTNLIVANVGYISNRQVVSVVAGPLYAFYIFSVLVFLGFIIANFNKAYKSSDGRVQNQIVHSAVGIVLSFTWILLTGAIIPAITHDWAISKIGNLGSIILISITGYSIIRHRLFDIQLVIARSLAYFLSLATLAGIFGVVTFAITNILFHNSTEDLHSLKLIYTLFALVIALTFAPIKEFFDRITNSFFYRDAYDSQVFLNQLNNAIIDNIEIGVLLRHTAKTIEENIKCKSVVFSIYNDSNQKVRLIGSAGVAKGLSDMDIIRKSLRDLNTRMVVYDELENSLPLKKAMSTNDVAILAHLGSSKNTQELAKAYVSFGSKKSGNAYSEKDIELIEIIVNELVIAIQNAFRFEEIQGFNATLQERINNATHKVRKANEKLEALDEAKDDFISMASHQLRTPLTSVKGYISMVLEGDAGKITPQQRQLLTQAFSSSQRMVYIIADLLNVSRLRTGKFVMEPTEVNLAEMVDQELIQLKDAATIRDLKLVYDKPKNFPIFMLDDTKTRQVIMNFVDNAIYYTPSKGRITISLVDRPNSIELKVEDTGIGVPRNEQHYLFTKFYRAANARKARPDGTGLGLFMAKKVIISQHGSLVFESKEGQGSTFGFMFHKSKLLKP